MPGSTGPHRGGGRRSGLRATVVAAVALCALTSSVTGCSDPGSSSTPASTTVAPRPITAEEASTLADVLVNNYEAGGASVRATVPFGVATFTLTGDIDWARHVGRVRVHPEVTGGTAQTDFDIVWNPNTVLQQLAGLPKALAAAGLPPATWVAVPLDAKSSPLHVVLQIIDSAASIQRDNPVLLLSRNITHVRTDTIDATAVDVFNLGRSSYWVDATSMLRRIEATLSATSSTAVVDFTAPGPRTIEVPTDVVEASAIPDIYARLTGKG